MTKKRGTILTGSESEAMAEKAATLVNVERAFHQASFRYFAAR
ncbi:MAG: hypothetical protein RMM16_10955 [Chloroherpetonaceae bacterium]|nr:hypothetical protein [Chloroherpetonaceae bacterium]